MDHIAVDNNLALAQPVQVDRRPQAAANQPRDLLRAPFGRSVSRSTRWCVLRGSIAYSAVTQPWRCDERCSQRGKRSSTVALHNTFVSPMLISHRAFRVQNIIEFESDRAQFIFGPLLRSHV